MSLKVPNEDHVYVEVANSVRQLFNNLPVSSNPDYHVYFNDFLSAQDYATGDWTLTTTEAGSGNATEAIGTGSVGGELIVTNDNADNDVDAFSLTNEGYKLVVGKKLWFEARLHSSVANDADIFMGLGITDTTPLASTDCVGFRVNDGNASITALCCKNSVETNEDTEFDLEDAIHKKLAFHWNGSDKVSFFVDRVLACEISTNVPDDEELCIQFCIQNGSANARVLTIDYLWVVQER